LDVQRHARTVVAFHASDDLIADTKILPYTGSHEKLGQALISGMPSYIPTSPFANFAILCGTAGS
jgi:hypothetical protein